MNTSEPDFGRRVAIFVILLLSMTTCLPAQTACPGLGSQPIDASWERSFPLLCAAAPTAPAWHLYTPAHRAMIAKPGFRPGDARALPRILVTWRCTGLLFPAVVVDRIRTMGYVLDIAESPCIAAMPTVP